VASVPPAPALIDRIAPRWSCSPENSSAVRSRSKSFSSPAADRSSSALSSGSADSSTSSSVVRRSSTRVSNPRHSSISERRPSASRRIFWARRWSSQNPGSLVSPSSWATRRSFVSRSKTPRGRPDPLGQPANRGRVHSVAGLDVLEQDRTELDQPKGGLAPGDDGVHARAVAVVGADAAVAVAVEGCRVAARSAVTFTGDEIDERRFLGLLQIVPLSVLGPGWERDARFDLQDPPDPESAGISRSIGPRSPTAKREKPKFRPPVRSSRGNGRPRLAQGV
jgi:hypothetical protein